MPKVPGLEERTVAETQGSVPGQEQLPPGALNTGFERTTGAAIGLLEGTLAAEKKKVDQGVVIESDLKLTQLRSQIEVERNRLKGRDSAGAIDEVDAEWQAGVKEIEKGLTNDTQRLAFGSRAASHYGSLYNGTLKYTETEMLKWDTDNRNSWEDLKASEAVVNHADPEEHEKNLAELEAELKDRHKGSPLVAADKYQDYLTDINKGIKDLKAETDKNRVNAEREDSEAANKELVDLQIDDALSIGEIRARRDRVSDTDYKGWIDRFDKEVKSKEKETAEVRDDRETVTDFSVEAMTMVPGTTIEEIVEFKNRVAQAVSDGLLKPTTARSIVSDAENSNKIDPMRKEAEKSVANALKNDYNEGLMGEAGPETDLEYTRQIESFRAWSRSNLDKEPSEYYEMISEPYKREGLAKFFGLAERADLPRRREEIAAEVEEEVEPETFELDRVYTDAQGRRAKYLGDGKWQIIQ